MFLKVFVWEKNGEVYIAVLVIMVGSVMVLKRKPFMGLQSFKKNIGSDWQVRYELFEVNWSLSTYVIECDPSMNRPCQA